MIKLLNAEFARLFRSKILWLMALIMFVWSVTVVLSALIEPHPATIDTDFLMFICFEGFFYALFISIFIGTDYSDGTIRNKIIIGHKRSDIYLSKFIVCFVGANIINLSWLVVQLGIGLPLLGVNPDSIRLLVISIGINVLLTGAYTAIFTLTVMLTKNKAAGVVAAIIVFMALLLSGSMTYNSLAEPENITMGTVTDTVDGEEKVIDFVSEPNPKYLTGEKREITTHIVDIIPGGQSIRLIQHEVSDFMPIYSLAVIVVVTAAGIANFNKKDIN
jgi:ABC-type transport system involved in multi-copper enzyme maturation permease subunit